MSVGIPRHLDLVNYPSVDGSVRTLLCEGHRPVIGSLRGPSVLRKTRDHPRFVLDSGSVYKGVIRVIRTTLIVGIFYSLLRE